jgi:phytoene synthase
MAGLTAAELSDRVAAADRDRWLASLFVPEAPRVDIHALLAFSAEVASVRDHVSAPLAGEIRLQWWRDALADPAQGRGHPLAEALADVIARHRLPVAALASLIDARVFDLYDDAVPSLNDLEGYLGETASALFQLSALILADGADPGTAELSGHAGVAYGLTGLMRALPLTSGRGQCFLPADRLAAHGASRETVVARQATPAVLATLAELRAAARRHLEIARDLWRQAPAAVRPAFLPLALVGPNLAALERHAATPFADDLGMAALRRPLVLWWAARRL